MVRPDSYDKLLCKTRHYYSGDEVETVSVGSIRGLNMQAGKGQKEWNILILPIESLTLQAFHSEMPKTKKALNTTGSLSFSNFHHRSGNTRANVIPLLLGRLVPYRMLSAANNITCIFDLTKKSLLESSLWQTAAEHGYATLQGGTACNAFVGCNRLLTSDGYVFHDNLNRFTSFNHSFPYGAFYAPKHALSCTDYKEAKTAEDILRCDGEGPHLEKALDYYKLLRLKNKRVRTFSLMQVEEPHGNKIYWPIDNIVADFVQWVIAEDDTILVFLGDHGDSSGTPLVIVPPSGIDSSFHLLGSLTSGMIIHDNVYTFLRGYLDTMDISSATSMLIDKIQSNECADYEQLEVCFCEAHRLNTQEELKFDVEYEKVITAYIQSKTSAAHCATYEAPEVSNIRMEYKSVTFHVSFSNGSVYAARFTSPKNFTVSQNTRYHSQRSCTPHGVHPEFCICDQSGFERSNRIGR